MTRGIIAAALVGIGTLHFVPRSRRTMAAIVPPAIVDRSPVGAQALVVGTGVCEIAGAAGLLLPRTRRAAGAALVAFYAAVFPANAYAARHPERFGVVAVPFWPRLGFQVALAGLTAWAAFEHPLHGAHPENLATEPKRSVVRTGTSRTSLPS